MLTLVSTIADRRPRLDKGGDTSLSLSSDPLVTLPELRLLLIWKYQINISIEITLGK